jgi:endo-1,4-beta-xylanase
MHVAPLRRAAVWLVVPLLAAVGATAVTTPAQAQSDTLRGAAGNMRVGAAVTPALLGNSTYANLARTHFSSVTAENHMKWDTTEPSQNNFNFGPGDQIVQFAQQNNQQVYGHTLVWHSQTPGWVQGLNRTQMLAAMQNHINQLLTRWPNVARWDVANEVISDNNGQPRQSFWFNAFGGLDYVAEAFRAARAADPDAVLCLNDYSIDGMNAKSNAYFTLVQQLLAQGVPINCMSFQAHLIQGQVPGDMQQNLQRFANLSGIQEIWVTELDVRIPLPVTAQKLQGQASDFARVFQICQQVTKCAGVTTWGIHDGQSWVDSTFPEFDSPLLWDDNFNAKPAFNAVLQQLGGGSNQEDPPAAPTGLTATATANSVSLSWSASAGATSYQVLRAPGTSGGSFTQVGTSSGTSFTNTGLSADQTFRYQVTASNANGTSPPSNTVTVTTQPGGGGGDGCSAVATVQTQWQGGYVVQPVTVTNSGSSSISGWTVTFTLPAGHQVVGSWNAQFSPSGQTITATNMSYNGNLSPSGSTSFGFQISRPNGDTQTPSGFTCAAN